MTLQLNLMYQNRIFINMKNDIITNIPSDKIEDAAKLLHVSPAYIMGGLNVKHSPLKTRILMTNLLQMQI